MRGQFCNGRLACATFACVRAQRIMDMQRALSSLVPRLSSVSLRAVSACLMDRRTCTHSHIYTPLSNLTDLEATVPYFGYLLEGEAPCRGANASREFSAASRSKLTSLSLAAHGSNGRSKGTETWEPGKLLPAHSGYGRVLQKEDFIGKRIAPPLLPLALHESSSRRDSLLGAPGRREKALEKSKHDTAGWGRGEGSLSNIRYRNPALGMSNYRDALIRSSLPQCQLAPKRWNTLGQGVIEDNRRQG